MFQFFAADAFFGMAKSIAPTAFYLDEMQDAIPASDNVHFITAVTEVALKDGEALFDQPLCCQLFSS